MISRKSNQRGAIALLTAVSLGTLLLFVALAVDTGRLFLERRSLQQLADLGALQAAQLYCSGFGSLSAVEAEVRSTLQAHGFNPDDSNNNLTVSLGTLSTSSSNRRQFSSSSDFQAVQVELTRQVSAALFAGSLFNTATLSATSSAQRDLIATLSAGNALISVDSDQSEIFNALFDALLDGSGSLNLTAASYNGLIDSSLTIGELIAELSDDGILSAGASVSDFATLELTLSELLSALSDALTTTAGDSDAIAAVNDILNEAVAAGTDGESINLADIFKIDDAYAGDEQADESEITPLQMISAGLLAIRTGDSVGITVNVDTSSIPLIDEIFGNTLTQDITLDVQGAPTIAIGRFGYDSNNDPITLAESANVELASTVNINLGSGSGGLIASLLGSITTVEGDIGLAVATTQSEAWLDQISQCPRLLNRTFSYTVGASPGIASIDLQGASSGTPATIDMRLTLLSIGLLDAEVGIEGSLPVTQGSDDYIAFTTDLSQPDALPTEQGTSDTALADAVSNGITSAGNSLGVSVSATTLLGIPITLSSGDEAAIINDLLAVLEPILTGVAELALDPVLQALGLSVGEVRVQILDVEEGKGDLMI